MMTAVSYGCDTVGITVTKSADIVFDLATNDVHGVTVHRRKKKIESISTERDIEHPM